MKEEVSIQELEATYGSDFDIYYPPLIGVSSKWGGVTSTKDAIPVLLDLIQELDMRVKELEQNQRHP